MAPRITPWLGELVADELRAVLQWKTLVKQEPDAEHVRQERFSDDGSNFRSNVTSPPLGDENKLQIMNVVSTDKLSFVVVSDGVTQMRAFLNDYTVTVLEEEMGSSLAPGMQGDLLIIREMTIISTPWGSEDGYIQINIDEIEYAGHLRKAIGQPRPIEQRPDIESLIIEIGDFRRKQNASDDTSPGKPSPGRTRLSDTATPASQGWVPNVTNNRFAEQSLKRPRSRSASPIALTQVQRQGQVATQNIVRGKMQPITASLGIDGFEIDSGLNLSGPRQSTVASILSSTSSPKKAHLFSLLKNVTGTKSDKEEPKVKPATASWSGSASNTNVQGSSGQNDQTPPESNVCRSPPSPNMTIDKTSTQIVLLTENHNIQSHGEKPIERSKGHVKILPSQTAFEVADRSTTYEGQFAPGTLSSDCGKDDEPDNVSREQESLLEDPSCWIPSYVGQQLPVPNIPVSFIRQWQVLRGAEKVSTRPDFDSSGSSETSSGTDSNDTFSADESITKDQWPSSPVRDVLPPDSTLEQKSNDINDGSAVGQHVVLDAIAVEPLPMRQRTPPSSSEIGGSVAGSCLPLRSPAPNSQTQHPDVSLADGSNDSQQASPSESYAYDPMKPKSSDSRIHSSTLSGTDENRPAYLTRPDTLHRTVKARCKHAERLASQESSRRARLLPASPGAKKVNAHESTGSFSDVVDQLKEPTRSADRRSSTPVNLVTSSTYRKSPTAMPTLVPSSQSRVPLPKLPYPPSSPHHMRRRYAYDDQNQVQQSVSPNRVMVKSTQFPNDRDEMEIDIPVPLEDPAILHHRRRREHFDTIRRQSRRCDETLPAQDLQMHTRKRHQIDNESTRPQPSSHRNGLLKESLLTLTELGKADQSQFALRNGQPSTYCEQTSTQTGTSTTDNQYPSVYASGQPSSIVDRRQIPLIDLTQNHAPREQQPIDQESAAGADTSRRSYSPLDTLRATASRATASRTTVNEQPSDVFREFAQTWNGIAPGGAFASLPPPTRQRKETADWKIDVLSWGWD
nr:hypothetical protein CFP56_09415 [Quercus suber]